METLVILIVKEMCHFILITLEKLGRGKIEEALFAMLSLPFHIGHRTEGF